MEKATPTQDSLEHKEMQMEHKETQMEHSKVDVQTDEPVPVATISKSSSKASLLSPLESNLPLSLSKEETDRITRIFSSRPPIPPIARGSSWGDLTQSSTNAAIGEEHTPVNARSEASTSRPMSAPLTSVVGWSFGVPREVRKDDDKTGIDETTEEEEKEDRRDGV